MAKEDCIEFEGTVMEAVPGAMFRVQVELPTKPEQEPVYHEILATLAGKLRVNGIKILVGDFVRVETSPYDLARGRITWRFKGNKDQKNKEQSAVQVNTSNNQSTPDEISLNSEQNSEQMLGNNNYSSGLFEANSVSSNNN